MTRRAIRGASCLLLTLAVPAVAAELTVDTGGPRIFTTAELLARPDAATITVPDDATYRREMTYRAVPLRALIEGAPPAVGHLLRQPALAATRSAQAVSLGEA